ncbi:MAG: 2-isopropylmalate synthase, partial [Candidatus Bathyarchaeota archaeon]|nr:2-isopropylmalate synthase [Candidatus Bathyarchaeota archaeon]
MRFLDTTLRDGEQTPGVSLKPEEKLRIALALDELNVDVIEAGFPAASEGEFLAAKMIAEQGLKAEVCGMSRGVATDIDSVAKAGCKSIHLVIPSSDLHITYKLGKSREEVLSIVERCVGYAKSYGLIVELSAEDGSRSDEVFLEEFFRRGLDAGADRLCICDTVGILTPSRTYKLFARIVGSFSEIPVSVHCHDDFGLAVANSIAAVEAGARQVHVTVNGLGERAGNAALEETAVTLKILYGYDVKLNLTKIYEVSQLVSRITGVPVPPNKAIVGDNAFTHESGIHTHGILRNPSTYEPIPPEVVGRRRRLVAGKHAGRHGIEAILKDMGLNPTVGQLEEIFHRVKAMGDKGRKVTDVDLRVIAENVMGIPRARFVTLEELVVVTGDKITPTASVKLKFKDRV